MTQFQAYNKILISENEGIQNVKVGNMVIGYEFYGQYPSYRGTFLSCIQEIEIIVDGEVIPNNKVYFCLNGKQALLSQLKDLYLEYWFVLDKARYLILHDGGLSEGVHSVTINMRHLIPYTGYHGDYLVLSGSNSKTLICGGEHRSEVKKITPMTTKPVDISINPDIQLCLTLYAMSNEYIHGIMDLEECIKRGHDMGYTGIELIASQMIPTYPHPTKEWMDHFKEILDKYQMHPVTYSAYIDMGTHADRDLTEDEIIQSTINDMMYAKYMGFDLVRTQHAISPSIFKKMLHYAREIGIILTIELHSPHTPEVGVWKEYLEIMRNSDGWLGVVPDFSIFAETPHKLNIIQAIDEMGCHPKKVNEIISRHKSGEPKEVLLNDTSYSKAEKLFVEDIYHTYGPFHLEWIDLLMPMTKYIHCKFWYLEEDEQDHTIPCDKIIPMIKASGYRGYIATEYEGHHYDDTIDTCQQLTRYANMLKRLLAN